MAIPLGLAVAEGGEPAGPSPAPTALPASGPRFEDWKSRFEKAARQYFERGERSRAIADLTRVLEGSLSWARGYLEDSRRLCELYESQRRLFEAEKTLEPLLRKHQAAWFELALRDADGPSALEELRSACGKRQLLEEKARVEAVLARIKPLPRAASDHARRAQAREAREQARKVVRELKEKQARTAAAEIRKVLDWMARKGFSPLEARTRLKDLTRRMVEDRDQADDLLQAIDDLPLGPPAAGDERSFESQVGRLVKGISDRLLTAVDRCIAAGEPALAFELFQYLLRFDPENRRAHRGLGHVLVEDRWLRPFEAEQYRAGLVWDDRRAWILHKEKGRYDRGEHFDLEEKRWDSLQRWDEHHADVAHPWNFQSEHFQLLSTANLALSAEVLKRLEAFFLQVFAQYDLFFSRQGDRKGEQRATELIFGVAPVPKRLVVHFYRDEAQFKAHAKPPTKWAAGFYSPSAGASFFYAVGGRLTVRTLQHELTHQILGELSSGQGPPWLVEGAAVYLENASFDHGALTPGELSSHPRLAEYAKLLRQGKEEHSFRAMLRFRTYAQWDSGDINTNYRGAGALVHFLMTMDGGRYRGDVIQMLRDSYSGISRPPEEYFGLSLESLDYLMDRFYRHCRP